MEYLPTFTIILSQMEVNMPYMEHMGIHIPRYYVHHDRVVVRVQISVVFQGFGEDLIGSMGRTVYVPTFIIQIN